MNPHERVSNRIAALMYKHFNFNEPCTRTIHATDKSNSIIIQVPTYSHAIDFLTNKGYEVKLDTFEEDFNSVVCS